MSTTREDCPDRAYQEAEKDRQEALKALAELKSVYQGIGAVGVRWRRCKAGTKRFRELEKAHDELSAKGWELSDRISAVLRFG